MSQEPLDLLLSLRQGIAEIICIRDRISDQCSDHLGLSQIVGQSVLHSLARGRQIHRERIAFIGG